MQVFDTTTDNDEPVLSHAILLYLRQGTDTLMREDRGRPGDAVLTLHRVVNGEIQAGTSLQEDMYAGLVHAIGGGGGSKIRRILPPHILFAGHGDRLMWHVPAAPRYIWFKTGKRDWDADMNGRVVMYPSLLFLAKRGSLSVWALKGAERPDPATPVYRAPFYNIYPGGEMCEGNAPLPPSLDIETIPLWERAFFETEFTQSNYRGGQMTTHMLGHDGYWRSRAFSPEVMLAPDLSADLLARPGSTFDPDAHLAPLADGEQGGQDMPGMKASAPRPLTIGVLLNS